MRLFGAKEPASVRWQRADSLILLGLPTDKQRHADRARCRAPNLTTAQESTESGDSLAEQHDWRAAFDMVSVTQSGCFVRICLGQCLGSCVVVSRADGAGAVRRDCCGDCEADAYTADDRRQETAMSAMHQGLSVPW